MSKLSAEAAPHIHSKASGTRIMSLVLLALMPAAIAGCMLFGRHAVLLLAVTTGSAVIFEFLFRVLFRKKQTVSDLSAAVSGLIYGMLLPPDLPLSHAVAGCFIAIVVVKQMFGGIGRNFANPAAVGWIAMLAIFREEMTTWRIPESNALTRTTPLMAGGTGYWDLLLGNCAGYIGQTCAAGLMLGAVFLCMTRVISPASTLCFIGSFALLTLIGGYDVPAQLFSGSLMLSACFLANDYTTTPLTVSGKCIFGCGCGILTFIIRHFGGYPEGAVFAVVIMNLAVPAIERLTKQKPFGFVPQEKKRRKRKTAAEHA